MTQSYGTADLWDKEYAAGRYHNAPPVEFVHDILAAAHKSGVKTGIYIGCGNGRNYLPLLAGGLDLIGLDISGVAIQQLKERMPSEHGKLLHGDLSTLPAGRQYDIVIGIQVFQHGNRRIAHEHLRAAQERVAVGGIMAVRVNAIHTDVAYAHDVTETGMHNDGFTVCYQAGPKAGQEVRFFAHQELANLFADDFEVVSPVQPHSTVRQPPGRGQWTQWEGIWRQVSPKP
jgi:hypothetical protein